MSFRATRSRAGTNPPAPTNVSNPSDIATTGYPNKTTAKGKTPISSLHFNHVPTNTYTGSTVKAKSRTTPAPPTKTAASNSFAALAVDAGVTLEEELTADLLGIDGNGEKSGGDLSSSEDSFPSLEYMEGSETVAAAGAAVPATAADAAVPASVV
ncbi:hypothetical protein B0H16DRAFT_1468397 [Mycena metata]|uniref:Uncharacterized protein n=1 Tax=Mycena metata TaxID=1033252 RepID=A0AAD7I377_9AGAR|nr:hypothetical protein B0H16DRAFT_1468397 [Mycena metata]